MATEKLNVTFDGVTEVSRLPGQNPAVWSNKFMTAYNVYHSGPEEKFLATANLTGTGWQIKYLRLAGDDSKIILKDLDAGAGREIRFLELGLNSDVDLISTRARYVFGWGGEKHDVTLGDSASGSSFAINIYAKENILTTGNKWVQSINTGWYDGPATQAVGDTITIGSGGAGSVDLGVGADTVVTTGWVRSMYTGDGNDKVNIGASGAGTVRTADGKDKVTTGKGWVELITTGDGDDIVDLGSGGAGLVGLGSGDDLIRVQELDNAGFGVIVRAEGGNDTISFKGFKKGVTFSLDLGGQFQNVAGPGTPDVPASGYFSENFVENLIGSNKADFFTGDSEANKLVGLNGNDRLVGLAGNDRLDGGKGNDILEGGKGKDTLIGGGGRDVFVFSAKSGVDKVRDFADGSDELRIADHSGGFAALSISDKGGNLKIVHDGGTILLIGEAGTTLSGADFDFV